MNPPAQNQETPPSPPALDTAEQEFVALWRNMAGLWGISPTMAQIHGLLFITGEALSMDDIMSRLGISRGNVSMSLAKLTEWGLVRRVHRRGDRRDYYETLGDVWELFSLVAAQRKRREIDPMISTLRQCRDHLASEALLDEAGREPAGLAGRRRRVDDLLAFLTLVDELARRFFENNRSLRAAVELLARKE